jgi:hypothetical protein
MHVSIVGCPIRMFWCASSPITEYQRNTAGRRF